MTAAPVRLVPSAPRLVLALALAATVASFATGCGGAGGSLSREAPLETQADYEARLAQLAGDLEAAIGDAAAETEDQCRVVPIGAKPCGGPWAYRVYSEGAGDPARVRALVARYTELQAEMNARFELASDCALVPEPTVGLVGGYCVVQ